MKDVIMLTGLGPFRRVADSELRAIFHLTGQGGKAFMISFTVGSFAGAENPAVTPLLRALLYVRLDSAAQRAELRRAIEHGLNDRNLISIRAKLLSLMTTVMQRLWAFPACLSTTECIGYWRRMRDVAGYSAIPSDRTGDAASGLAIGRLLRNQPLLAFGAALLNQFSGQSKDYYDFYARRLSDELALRGIPPNSLR